MHLVNQLKSVLFITIALTIVKCFLICPECVAQDSLNVNRLGQLGAWWSEVRDVAVQENYAYVVDATIGLVVVTISDPTHPEMAATLTMPHDCISIFIAGHFAYITAENPGLVIVDISNPLAPVIVSQMDYSNDPSLDIVVVDSLAYIAKCDAGLNIVNVSNTATPFAVGSYDAPECVESVVISGSHAYIAEGLAGLLILDISDPTSPLEIGHLDTPGYARRVALLGTYAYIADDLEGIRIIDIADPAAPTEVGWFDSPDFSWDIKIEGTLAYVADWTNLLVLSLDNPLVPVQIGTINVGGEHRVVVVSNSLAFLPNGWSGLHIVSVADSSTPLEIGQQDSDISASESAIYGNYAYVAAQEAGVSILDISNPRSPLNVGSLPTTWTKDVTISGHYLYVSWDYDGMRIYDVQNPISPIEVGAFDSPGATQSITIVGSLAYLSDGPDGLHIVDVSDPSNPIELGHVTTPGWAYGTEVLGNFAYIADGWSGLRIIDVSNPMTPIEISSVPTDFTTSLAAHGQYIYIANGWGIKIVNVSDPVHPNVAGELHPPNWTEDVIILENRLFVANRWSGLQIYDVADPINPLEVGFYNTPGQATGISVNESTAYLSDGSFFGLYDCSNALAFPSIVVTRPNGGEALCPGTTDTIRWNSHDIGGNVRLELNRNFPIGNWEIIAANTANDGIYEWPVTGVLSAHSRVKITSVNFPLVQDQSDSDFTIWCIRDNGHWIRSHSPYLISNDITIPSGQTLIIDPGVTIRFTGAFKFTVQGTLLASGSDADSILFTTDTLTNPSKWRGLRFVDSTSTNSILRFCRLEYAESPSDWGGAVSCTATSPRFEHCTITRSHAPEGGAFGFFSLSQATIESCLLENNRANTGGAGGAVSSVGSQPIISNCIIKGNTAGRGGGVHFFSFGAPIVTPILNRCVLVNNTGFNWGGGLDVDGGGDFVRAKIANCTFVSNTSPNGGSIFINNNNPKIENTIVSFSNGSGLSFQAASACTVRYCDIFGNTSAFGGIVPSGLGQINNLNNNHDSCDSRFNIFLDPEFANRPVGNYQLVESSPCIDGGNPFSNLDEDSTISDIGVYTFNHLSTLALIQPNGRETWFIGDSLNILWIRGTDNNPVNIELDRSYPSGTWESITLGAPNTGSYMWVVSGQVTSTVRLRVVSVENSLLGDTTSSNFSIAIPYVNILHPDGGNILYTGLSDTIRWTSNLQEYVRMELMQGYPDGTWTLISSSTSNDGSEAWAVGGQLSENVRIRVVGTVHTNVGDTSTSDFAIRPPTLTVTAPNGGEILGEGNSFSITWSSIGLTGNVNIQINRNYPSGSWTSLFSNTPNDGQQSWTVTSPLTNNTRIRILSSLQPSIGDTSNNNFSIVRPTITLLTPNCGDTLAIGQPYNISWTSQNLLQSVNIQINRTYPSASWTPIVSNTPNDGGQSWTVTSPTTCTARFRITAANNLLVSDTSDCNSCILNSTLVVTSPNGAESWDMGQSHNITWTSTNLPGTVQIDVNRNYPAGAWDTLTTNTINDGIYSWLTTYPATTNARFRLTSRIIPTITDISNANFTIPPPPADSLPGPISLQAPPDGEAFVPNTQVLSWLPVLNAQFYDVYLWRIADPVPSSPMATVTGIGYLPSIQYGTSYRWRVRVRNAYGETISSTRTFMTQTLPDLQVTDIQVPPEIHSGQSVQISWTISNTGLGRTNTPEWPEYVYISPDIHLSDHDALDILLGSYTNISYLDTGQNYTQVQQITIPYDHVGYYYLFVSVDNTDAWSIDTVRMVSPNSSHFGPVQESNNINNFRYLLINILPSPTPDLVVTAVNPPTLAFSGATVPFSWIVQNTDSIPTISGSWSDAVYLSSDSVYNSTDTRLLTQPHTGNLAPDSSYFVSTFVTIPYTTPTGDYYYIVRTDVNSQEWEFVGESNNNTISTRKQIQLTSWPDLHIQSMENPPQGSSGYPLSIAWTVQNNGIGDTYESNWSDRVYLSTSPIFNVNQSTAIGTFFHTGILQRDSVYSRTAQPIIPNGFSGIYYCYVYTDWNNQVFENGLDSNNILRSDTTIFIRLSPWPDLEVSSVSVTANVQAGSNIHASFVVTNSGDTTITATWADRIYLSLNPNWSLQNLIQFANLPNPNGLSINETYTTEADAQIPANLSGIYYVYVRTDADSIIYEHGEEENNILRSDPITITPYPPIDLTASGVTIPDSANSGQQISIEWTVQNIGLGRTLANSWEDAVYLSSDQILNQGDQLIGTIRKFGALNPSELYHRTTDITIPNGYAGNCYMIIKTDSALANSDVNPANNIASSAIQIHISLTPSPDLVVTSLDGSDADTSGQPATIHWTVLNQGDATTPVSLWYDGVYLSLNTTVDDGDIRLGTYTHSGYLPVGDSYTGSLTATIPLFAFGNYYLLVKTDTRDDMYEHNGEQNNTRNQLITLTLPPPCDLIVTNIQVPDSAMPGDEITVSYTLENIGPNTAIGWIRDGVYFSSDTTWDINDALLGFEDRNINIPSGGSLLVHKNVSPDRSYRLHDSGNLDEGEENEFIEGAPGIAPGRYYAVGRTDMRNAQNESSESNNLSMSVGTINISIVKVNIGDHVQDSITEGESKYYSLIIPDTLLGRNIHISVQTLDSSALISEFLLSASGIPNELNYDYGSIGLGDFRRDIYFDAVNSGQFFILIKATNQGHLSGIYTLGIETVELQLLDTEISEVGAGTSVTIGLSGTAFVAGMQAILENTLDSQIADTVFVSSSTEAYAKFNLSHTTLNVYDLTLRVIQKSLVFSPSGENIDSLVIEQRLDTIKSTLMNRVAITPVMHPDSTQLILVMPDIVRGGNLFGLSGQLINFSNVDVPSQLVSVVDYPDIEISIPGGDGFLFGKQQLLITSPSGPAGIIRPSQQILFNLQGRAPSSVSNIQISLRKTEMENEPFDLSTQLLKLGIGPESNDWQPICSYLTENYELNWYTWRLLLAQVATTNSADGTETKSADYFAQILVTTLRNALHLENNDHTWPFPMSLESLTDCPPLQEPLLDHFFCPDMLGTLGCESLFSMVSSWFHLNFSLSACYLDYWLMYPGVTCQQFFPFDDDMSKTFGKTKTFKRKHQRVIDGNTNQPGVKELIEEKIRQTDGICPPDISEFSFLSDEFLGEKIKTAGFGDEWRNAFGDMDFYPDDPDWPGHTSYYDTHDGEMGIVSIVNCEEVASPECTDSREIKYTARVDYLFRDIYHVDFGGFEPRWLFGISCCAYQMLRATPPLVRPFVTAFWIRKEFDGKVELTKKHKCCDRSDECCSSSFLQDNCPPDCQGSDCDGSEVTGSVDPNEITGLDGYGQESWIMSSDYLPYTIYYENDSTQATAPAQIVHITQHLNSTINPTSFRLGNFGFGSFSFDVPPNRAFYTNRLDVRDSLGVYVDVTAGINLSAREIFWNFESIDPRTGQTPNDPFTGFLPVNDSLGRGQGFVTYTVLPKSDAQTGDRIDAQATIIFDQNEPLDTPPIFNTIDAGVPTSRMDTQAVFLDSTQFTLHWSGHDDSLGSGIAGYDLYCSLNYELFTAVATGLTDTFYTIHGLWYNNYRFFLIATDNVGHIEPMKFSPEIEISLMNKPNTLHVDSLMIRILQGGPNPSAQLDWTHAVMDSAIDSTMQIGYWIYSRFSETGHDFVWDYFASTDDTTYELTLQNGLAGRRGFFLVVGYPYQITLDSKTNRPEPPRTMIIPESGIPATSPVYRDSSTKLNKTKITEKPPRKVGSQKIKGKSTN